MRVSFRMTLAASLIVTAVGAGRAGAQTIPSPYTFLERAQEAGAFVGYVTFDKGRFGYGPSGGLVLGGRYGVQLAGPVSLEGVLGFVASERDVVNPGRDEGDRVVGTVDAGMTTVEARIKFSLTGDRAWRGLSPFLVVGAGLVVDAAGISPLDDDLEPADRFEFGTGFLATLGGGTRWFVTDGFALRVDGVFSLWRLDTPPGFSDPARGFAAVEEGEWVRGLGITISGTLHW